MTKFVRLPLEMIKTKELFAPTTPNKFRLNAETAVLQTVSQNQTDWNAGSLVGADQEVRFCIMHMSTCRGISEMQTACEPSTSV